MSATGLNLEAIQRALDQHAATCDNPVTALRMNPWERERLGFDDFRGIPIESDEHIGTGVVRVVCQKPKEEGLSDEEHEQLPYHQKEPVAA